jgi:hypothetical protein
MDIFNTMKLELSNAVPISQKMLISISEGSTINLENIHLFSTVPPPTPKELLDIANLKKKDEEEKSILMNLEGKVIASLTGTNNKYFIQHGISINLSYYLFIYLNNFFISNDLFLFLYLIIYLFRYKTFNIK